jgi:outer membrane protein assembly factor BamD (BamD/ComL family)
LAEAVTQLREIEKFFPDHGAKAALEIARCYRRSQKKAEEIAALRHVMKKYQRSGESRHAHERLEELGVKIGGAVEDVHK